MAPEVTCVQRSLARQGWSRSRRFERSDNFVKRTGAEVSNDQSFAGYDIDSSSMNLLHHRNAFSRVSAVNVSDLPSVIHSSEAWAV